MRRFSQRNSLVTLSEINITPLLDLAFVLLIIFVITTPLLEQGMNLSLAKGGNTDDKLVKDNIKTVEIDTRGNLMLEGRRMTRDQVELQLRQWFARNPNMIVFIRADKNGRVEDLYDVINRCQRNGITKYSLRTEPLR
jgi:biopolymer transport protein ExbD